MQLDNALKNVSVIGAGGKMGSGIALLLLQEMARLEAERDGKVGKGLYSLILIDTDSQRLQDLRRYLLDQLFKYAEKSIIVLRKCYAGNPDLISNEEIIEAFVYSAMDIIQFHNHPESAKNSNLVFEAIIEDVDVKAKILSAIGPQPYFFSNTSSIPIHVLNEKANLNNRIIGFHFYNPPAVQRLIELIAPDNVDSHLLALSRELAKRLQKTVVPSHDIAGFIGNGHFIREALFACRKANELAATYSLPEAIYMINRVTQDYLVRPMGIFQLMDYVGIDVCHHICRIMSTYLKDPALKDNLLDKMLAQGVKGGQNSDGTQKAGFFQYDRHFPKSLYHLEDKKYHVLTENNFVMKSDEKLGVIPEGLLAWKSLQKDQDKNAKLKKYFENLFAQNNLGAELAQTFLLNSRDIARKLVQDGVANKIEDVNAVLELGFFHLYGADNAFLPDVIRSRQ